MSIVYLYDRPLTRVIFKKRYEVSEDFENMVCQLEKVYSLAEKENQKFCLLLDTSQVEYANPSLAISLVKWLLNKKEKSARYLICTCILIKNPLINNLLKCILQFFTPTRPYFIVNTQSEMLVLSMIMTVWENQFIHMGLANLQ